MDISCKAEDVAEGLRLISNSSENAADVVSIATACKPSLIL